MKKILTTLFFALILIKPHFVYAQIPDIKIGYETTYYLQEKSEETPTSIKIVLKNMKSDIYPSTFGISIPKHFTISQISALSNGKQTDVNTEDNESFYKITVKIQDPQIGKGKENIIVLNLRQKNIIKWLGRTWEAIFPTVSDNKESLLYYNIKVVLPDTNQNRKITVAKPTPDYIEKNTVYWNNVKAKVVYAVFGEKQVYKSNIKYQIKNDRINTVYTYITLPPDTSYQKLIINKLEPKPAEIKIDEDGNYLAKYFMQPKQMLDIDLNAYIETYPLGRKDMINLERKRFNKQKNYLLSNQGYWQIADISGVDINPELEYDQKAKLIYDFVVNFLSYDFNRLNDKDNYGRMGAVKAVSNPNKAVCTEYTDLFISLARRNGIYSREIQGYGYTDDQRFRPLSLVIDVLHTWPEYYDVNRQRWVAVDPTWEDTSGIDYFSFLDHNHIALAIHGKSDKTPYPAGAFRVNTSKVIDINPTTSEPKLIYKLTAEIKLTNQNSITATTEPTQAELLITNQGNYSVINKSLEINSTNLEIDTDKITIDYIAPFQTITYPLTIKTESSADKFGTIIVKDDDNILLDKQIEIKPIWKTYFDIISKYWILVIGFIFLLLSPLLLIKR
ncbi:MAG: hypothetical protein KatS3mg091_206 [Patescibacteria group bacterium]|nr:MAG: hypothetical protein KatS3mg091_206 [Patescibacteria group bacterium]